MRTDLWTFPDYENSPEFHELQLWIDAGGWMSFSGDSDLDLELNQQQLAKTEQSLRGKDAKLARLTGMACVLIGAVVAYLQVTGFTWWAAPALACLSLTLIASLPGQANTRRPLPFEGRGFISYHMPRTDPARYGSYLASSLALAITRNAIIDRWKSRWCRLSLTLLFISHLSLMLLC